ncbi:MAG: hypothetical protein CME62_10315 [Halobacteriovoraceae bacterium]|nr:hypothetical protein [Halobacteriovoraceae bacterium]|tara:strand:+ start:421 stop:1131 length:711 start_codon:yes stop_codon:yes gene_type:complete
MKFLSCFLLLFVSFGLFAQDSEEEAARKRILEQYQVKTQAAPIEPEVEEALPPEEEEAQPQNLPTADGIPEIDPSELEKIMANLEKNPLLKMLDQKQKEMAAKMMRQNPFQNMKRDMIRGSIMKAMDPEKPFGKFLNENPKIADTVADIAVDKKAIPAFMSILNKPDQMKLFGIIVIIVFITVFFLNLKNSKKSIFKRFLTKIFLMLSSLLVNLTAFYVIFKKELDPTLDIVFRNF